MQIPTNWLNIVATSSHVFKNSKPCDVNDTLYINLYSQAIKHENVIGKGEIKFLICTDELHYDINIISVYIDLINHKTA